MAKAKRHFVSQYVLFLKGDIEKTGQLKDIQYRSEKLISGFPSTIELENFARCATELKNYIVSHIEEKEIAPITDEIHDILEVEDAPSVSLLMLILAAICTLGASALYIAYVGNLRALNFSSRAEGDWKGAANAQY